MRIRIALATAVAVFAIPAVLFTLFSGTPAASARVTRHEAVSQHRTARITLKLMSFAQAEKIAKLANYYNAVTAHEQTTYYNAVTARQKAATFYADLGFFNAVAREKQQQQAAAQAAAAASARAQAPAPTPTATPTPAPAPATAPSGSSDSTSTNTADWACIRQHESGGNYGEGGGGAYQFGNGTWQSVTGLPGPAQSYPPATQDAAALTLFSQRGWQPWTTRYVCGL